MNIYIPIEVKVRELEGRSLLAIVAAERGHNVILGEKKHTLNLASRGKLPPGIVHMKSITPHESMINALTKLGEHGHVITVQDEESGLLDESYEKFAKLRFSKKTLSQVSSVFAWGDFDGKSLKEKYSDYAEKIVITGSPRVDFWRKEFEGYFENPTTEDEFQEKPYILVVSNFGSFLNENRLWNIFARLRKAGYFEREKNREFHEYENAAYQIRLVGKFVEMIRSLSEAYPKMNIIVRPHPVESIEGWRKIIGEYPNVFVRREGTISRWIRHSEMIIHNGCTSALEAAISGVTRVAYRPFPNDLERDIPNSLSINAFSLEELKKTVSKLLQTKRTKNIDDENYPLLDERIANQKGMFAADCVVDEWERLGNEHSLRQSDISELILAKAEDKKPLIHRLKRKAVLIRNKLTGKEKKNNSGRLLKSGHKFPDFKDEEIEQLLYKLQISLNRFKNVSYQRYGKKSFIITSNNKKL
jgi:surface carbohydrate biosynthesis protein